MSPFVLSPPCPLSCAVSVYDLPLSDRSTPRNRNSRTQPKKILLVMAACYLADPLGSGLPSLKFLVLEAPELSALGRADGGKGFVFLQVLGALISAFREGGGVRKWGLGRANEASRHFTLHATSPPLRGPSRWLRGLWRLGPQTPGLRLGGRV